MDIGKVKEVKLEGRVDVEEDLLGNSSEDFFDWKLWCLIFKVIESVKKWVVLKRCLVVDRVDGVEEDDVLSLIIFYGCFEKSLLLDEKLGEFCLEVKSFLFEI